MSDVRQRLTVLEATLRSARSGAPLGALDVLGVAHEANLLCDTLNALPDRSTRPLFPGPATPAPRTRVVPPRNW